MWSIGLCYHANTSVSEEPRVPLLLFSISSPRGVLLDRLMLLLSAQYHTLCITSVTGGLPRSRHTGRPDVMRMERNGRRGAPLESLFPFQSRASVFATSPQNRRERGPFISISHALIYISYIYLHTLLFCSGRGKDNSAKHVLVEAWLHISFPFSALYGVCQTQWTYTRRKVWCPPRPSNLIK